MSEIKAFNGITYNREKIKDLSRVISPPYDVINESDQEKYYMRDEHNIVRIILGKSFPSDNETDNRYTRAAQFKTSWLNEGILNKSDLPSLYVYEQQFTYKKKKYSRKGFIGLLKFEKKNGAKFHENTYLKAKEDRLELLKATQANTEPIFLFYKGDAVSIPDFDPIIDTVDDSGNTHRLWAVSDKKTVQGFCADFAGTNCYIADGHHRFETAQNYARSIAGLDENDPKNYIMSYFVEEEDEGLAVLPIHRVLALESNDIDQIMKTAQKYFLVVEIDSFLRIEKAVGHVFGFYNKKTNKLYMFKLRDIEGKNKIMASKGRKALRDIDVSILHSLLLDEILEKHKGGKMQEIITYTHDDAEAIDMVKKGRATCAFLLNPTKVSQIVEIADAGEKMPQKSTFFYPKPYSGLILRDFD